MNTEIVAEAARATLSGSIPFPEVVRRMEAGVQGYMAFLRGMRVTYWGRGGDHSVEWFPGAELPPDAS